MLLKAYVHVSLCLILLWTSDSNGSNSSNLNKEVLDRLLDALEKAYDFFDSEYEVVNLDGIYGLRVSEGALLKILDEQKVGKIKLKRSLLVRILKLTRTAAEAANRSLPHLKQSNPDYYKKFATAVAKPWENFKPFKRLDYTLYVPVNKRSQISFDEDTSDQCMTEMTGTASHIKKPCQLSGHCWDLMMAKGADGYALTHQALFLLIGEVQGCKKTLLDKLKSSKNEINLQHVYDRICASMYPQMMEFEKTHQDSAQYERDLYMEQAMVCGSMGYYEFLSVQRLNRILRWQRKNGCFGGIEDDDYLSRRTLPKNHRKYFNNDFEDALYDSMKDHDGKGSSRKLMSMRTMRSLLVEKALGGGCMSHITGVATGLLGVYLRWAVHSIYPSKDIRTTRRVSRDLPEQTHHMVQRKMMQSEPFVTLEGRQDHYQTLTKPKYILLIVFVLMWIFWHQLIIKQSSSALWYIVGFCNKTESKIRCKKVVQKRNICNF